MKKEQRKWFAVPILAAVAFLAVNPQPAYAIFGFGDIVFDPSSWASLGHIWGQDISNGMKLAETFNQTVKILKNGMQVLALGERMAQRVTHKDVWKTVAFTVGDEETERHYNERVNFGSVMNGDIMHAGSAYKESTRDGGDAGYLGNVKAANSRRMAEYATIQMLNQTSQRCSKILASYKVAQEANKDAENQLSTDAFDSSDAKNSMVAALNIISGGNIQLHTEAKAAGNLQACMAEQETLRAKVEQDKLSDEQNWYADIAKARAGTPASLNPSTTAMMSHAYFLP